MKLLRILAVFVVLLATTWSLYRAEVAIDLARTVDNQGDIRACKNENLIRRESNKRDNALEETAKLQVEALEVISNADRPERDTDTNEKLRDIADRAEKLKVEFPPAKLTNCEEAFPKP